MNLFKKYITKVIGLTQNHFEQLENLILKEEISKNKYLVTPGTVCGFLAFVNTGILRYYIDKEGDEFNIDFHFPAGFASVPSSCPQIRTGPTPPPS